VHLVPRRLEVKQASERSEPEQAAKAPNANYAPYILFLVTLFGHSPLELLKTRQAHSANDRLIMSRLLSEVVHINSHGFQSPLSVRGVLC